MERGGSSQGLDPWGWLHCRWIADRCGLAPSGAAWRPRAPSRVFLAARGRGMPCQVSAAGPEEVRRGSYCQASGSAIIKRQITPASFPLPRRPSNPGPQWLVAVSSPPTGTQLSEYVPIRPWRFPLPRYNSWRDALTLVCWTSVARFSESCCLFRIHSFSTCLPFYHSAHYHQTPSAHHASQNHSPVPRPRLPRRRIPSPQSPLPRHGGAAMRYLPGPGLQHVPG